MSEKNEDSLPDIDFNSLMAHTAGQKANSAPEIEGIQGSVVGPKLTADVSHDDDDFGDNWFANEATGTNSGNSGLEVLNPEVLNPVVSDASASVEAVLSASISVDLGSLGPDPTRNAETTAPYASPEPEHTAEISTDKLSVPLPPPANVLPEMPPHTLEQSSEDFMPPFRATEEVTGVEGVAPLLAGEMPMEELVEAREIELVIIELLEINNFTDFESKEAFLNLLMKHLKAISLTQLRGQVDSEMYQINIDGTNYLMSKAFIQMLSRADLCDVKDTIEEANLELVRSEISEITETVGDQRTVRGAIKKLLKILT